VRQGAYRIDHRHIQWLRFITKGVHDGVAIHGGNKGITSMGVLNHEQSVSGVLGGRSVRLSTGVMAKQANGSVVLRVGDMVLLATAVMSSSPKDGIDFFPLTVEFAEKFYADGRIPGGYFKREARPSGFATLLSRLIDRPIRPLFPDGFRHEVQVVVTLLSHDPTIPVDAYAIVAASAALSISDIPFNGPVGAALMGMVAGHYRDDLSVTDMGTSALHMTVAGTADAVLMIEAGASEVPESDVIQAIASAQSVIREATTLQSQLVALVGKPKHVPSPVDHQPELVSRVEAAMGQQIASQLKGGDKEATDRFLRTLEEQVITAVSQENPDWEKPAKAVFSVIKKQHIRSAILNQKIRPDGRALDAIRPIEIEVGVLPSTHGSSLFTRGETQSLGVVTLGTADDVQKEDNLSDVDQKTYFLHYNFPPYSVGEVGNLARTSRRELGHGALAERALKTVLPTGFPYTIRLVSEILESNGSSSMASVCSCCLALMDAGVPIASPVAGIAMGLLIEGDTHVVLSDIQGLEDHYGDMDFKVAGTLAGITALQLDIKVGGLTLEILRAALAQARVGRLHILSSMTAVLAAPRGAVAPNAPKIATLHIPPEKVGLLIGPGGKMIRKIEEETQATIVVTDGATGEVCVSAKNQSELDHAMGMIQRLTRDVEVGDVYQGKVTKVVEFGAFVELVPGKEGLMHISSFAKHRVAKASDVVATGQAVEVRVKEIDQQNRINLVPTSPLVG